MILPKFVVEIRGIEKESTRIITDRGDKLSIFVSRFILKSLEKF